MGDLKKQGLFLYIEENYPEDELMAVWAGQLKQLIEEKDGHYERMKEQSHRQCSKDTIDEKIDELVDALLYYKQNH